MKNEILKLAYLDIIEQEELRKEAVFSYLARFGGKRMLSKITQSARNGIKVKGAKPPKQKSKEPTTFAGKANRALFGKAGAPVVSLAGKGAMAIGRRLPGAIGTAGTGVYNTAKVALSGKPKGTAFWMGTGAVGSGFSSRAWESGTTQ